ncbi:MAG: hypothetical protein ABI554_12400 [Flavobacterium sp.]
MEVNEKIINFFDKTIGTKDFAKFIRRTNYILSLTAIRDNDNLIDKDWLDNSYYWLNEFAEVLDPYLDAK